MMKNKKPMGMYIHIPFCNKKCDYCDFVSYSMDEEAQHLYLDAMMKEIDLVKNNYVDCVFDSLYIGGGTPSIMFSGFYRQLSKKIFSSFSFKEKFEFTIEINPSSFSQEKFIEYLQSGVNRISIGVQCLDSNLLKEHGRIQSLSNIDETFEILNNADFDNICADVMIGLPKQRFEAVTDTLEYLLDKNVKHFSVYTLQVEKYTTLYDKIKRGKLRPLSEDTILEMYDYVYDVLMSEGYVRYEVSNFSRIGYESKHNQKYWGDCDYLGLGVSAHSFVGGYRFYNTKRLDVYIDSLSSNKSVVYKKQYVSNEEKRVERIMLSLRTEKGLDLEKFQKDFDESLLSTRAEQIKMMKDEGLIEIVNGYLRVTEYSFNVLNKIIEELL